MTRDRILFPESGFTKADAIDYYRRIAKVLLPHLKNVPVSFKRYPDAIRNESFWEKDAPSFTPEWVRRVAVPRRGGESDIHYILVQNARTLKWIAEVGGIEIHPFLHRAPRLERATSVVFDLDPGDGTTLQDCCEVALLLRHALERIELQSFAKVSGSKGLQVYVPLNTGATHESTEAFARVVAGEIARAYPKLVVAEMAKALRAKKVFIDWSQNADYKTTVSVYSLRAKREAPYVSMPVTWQEVERAADLDFTPEAALNRVAGKGDLFAPVLTLKQKLLWSAGAPAPAFKAAAPPPHSKRLRRSQSGRRLFILTREELWLEMYDELHRWKLHPEGKAFIAIPARRLPLRPEHYRGEVPSEDIGTYEIIEGSYQQWRFELWFTGRTLKGKWLLERLGEPWRLRPLPAPGSGPGRARSSGGSRKSAKSRTRGT